MIFAGARDSMMVPTTTTPPNIMEIAIRNHSEAEKIVSTEGYICTICQITKIERNIRRKYIDPTKLSYR